MRRLARPVTGISHTQPWKLKDNNMSEQRDLEGVTALVTGATSGIGKATAVQLGRHGADVIVHGRDAARGRAVVEVITAQGGMARFAAADLSDPAQIDDLAGQARSADVLVNNAGFSWIGPTAELDVATFDQLYIANVRAPYFLVAALGPKDGRPGERQHHQRRQPVRADRYGGPSRR